jgi:hypothetical protein
MLLYYMSLYELATNQFVANFCLYHIKFLSKLDWRTPSNLDRVFPKTQLDEVSSNPIYKNDVSLEHVGHKIVSLNGL